MSKDLNNLAGGQTRSPFHLFDKMMEGFALCEIICDGEGKPCDFRYLLVNQGFERLIGLKREEVVGRTAGEVFPGIEPMWIENYGRVALEEKSARRFRFTYVTPGSSRRSLRT